jgi:CRISPR-associated protein Cas1
MISLPDFKEKKILFISNTKDLENNLKFSNGNIKLYKEGKCINQVSCSLILCIFIVGDFTLTTALIRKVKEFGISIILLNYSFKPYAELMCQAEGNYALREVQYTIPCEHRLELSKGLIKNKLRNQMNLLKEYKSCSGDILSESIDKVDQVESEESLLGVEGNAASVYFKSLFKDANWFRRAPRTKEDIPNLLLDIGYTFLFNFVDACLRLFGFDVYKGFYHKLYFQRQSLTCDIMEPFRVIIDKALIKAIHLNKIDENDFLFKNGSFSFKEFYLQRKYTEIFFEAIEQNKEEIYGYVLAFYRYIQSPNKYIFPDYKY